MVRRAHRILSVNIDLIACALLTINTGQLFVYAQQPAAYGDDIINGQNERRSITNALPHN